MVSICVMLPKVVMANIVPSCYVKYHKTDLHLHWLHWVMQHKYDGFYMCRVAQGSQGKYSAVLLGEIPQDRAAFALASLGDSDTSTMVSICVVLPKVVKANTLLLYWVKCTKTELHLRWLHLVI
jgi:hypothetical protein